MNIIKFIESFTDDNVLRQTASRRQSIDHLGTIGKKSIFAALPTGLLTLLLVPGKSQAATTLTTTADTNSPTEALRLALLLEYLDSEFYQTGLDTNGLIPEGRDRQSFTKIVNNEYGHINTLVQALGGANSPNYFEKPEFDYTAGGLFDPFNNYDQFLSLSQSFEDTGVRAYKGQSPNLMSQPDLLQAALQIHATESRQAAEIRRLRGVKGWIQGNNRDGLPPQAQPVYNGEEMTSQAGVNTSQINNSGGPSIPSLAGTEAFDEPLTREQVLGIARMFTKDNPLE
jgi:hypothetical protein